MRTTLPDMEVSAIKAIHEGVWRLYGTNGAELDLPSQICDKVAVGDRYSLEIGSMDAVFENAFCILQGVSYSRNAEFVFISFGGLLAKLPTPLEANQSVRLCVSRAVNNKRRKRAESAALESAPTRTTRSRTSRNGQ